MTARIEKEEGEAKKKKERVQELRHTGRASLHHRSVSFSSG
jgi:hypothetical protein